MAKKNARTIVVLPDIHLGVPKDKQAERALECAIRVVETLKPDLTLQLGDLLDCAVFSSHAKKTLKDSEEDSYFEQEVQPGVELFDRIQASSGHLHFIEGNHCARVERFVTQNFTGKLAREMFEMLDPKLQLSYTAAGKLRKNFTVTPYAGELPLYKIAPNLMATHGFSHSTAASRKHLEMMPAGVSIVHGHTHRRQEATRRDPISGQLSFGWSPGCLTSLQPSYFAAPSNHSHGITVLFQSRKTKTSWTHYNVGIVNGRCILPCGTEVRA